MDATERLNLLQITIDREMTTRAVIFAPEDTPLTRESFTKIAYHIRRGGGWNDEPVPFDPIPEMTRATRVTVEDDDGNILVNELAIDPNPWEAGLALGFWLNGEYGTFQDVLRSAVEQRLIEPPVMEKRRGSYTTPGGETIEVEFEARKGATQEEIDLAFFQALAKAGAARVVMEDVCHE
jgi:hypothetical protein